MPTSQNTFTPDVIAAVLHHMNDDHSDDNLLIARAFGTPDAESATMIDLDQHGGQWTYSAAGQAQALTVPWTAEISERAEIRREIVVLYDKACATLGVSPRPH
ncbi:uncharacterized protein DUF2470 [Homoserinimonas aerilata]|uniref:Uncharacterized protein DUF2470 n=1 Tax=Homoserinimonas aerilata TaxID=1162970 RepID=A0A542YET6_9MICO|nr:DUF2470 domain-containing protein [Homoserinimonas aerilata]TQL46597.1 uncharacterized protein DUF2470 [Homoserinimonas aerilata]